MKDIDREILSRLMDGEWEGLEPAKKVAEASASAEQQRLWARYHLARDAMRGEAVNPAFSIASRVSAAIADEPAYSNVTHLDARSAATDSVSERDESEGANSSATHKARSRWGLGAAGLGIAASAALATVVGLDYHQTRSINEVGPALVANGAGLAPAVVADGFNAGGPATSVATAPNLVQPQLELVANRGSYWISDESGQRAATEHRLNMLLGDHIEHSPGADWRGMLPYSRLVGYDTSAETEQ